MAAVDYFLKIDGIEGESQDSKHKNEIDLESFSWGETQSGTHGAGGGGGAGKVSMQDFHFVMRVHTSTRLCGARGLFREGSEQQGTPTIHLNGQVERDAEG